MGRKNEQTEIDCLKKLISIQSCYNKEHDMEPIVAKLIEEFEQRGYKVRTFPTSGHAPVIVAEMNRGMESTLLFYNHYDVQSEEPLDEWKSNPYDLSLRNERFYGRGVTDNKGPLVTAIFGDLTFEQVLKHASEIGYDCPGNDGNDGTWDSW